MVCLQDLLSLWETMGRAGGMAPGVRRADGGGLEGGELSDDKEEQGASCRDGGRTGVRKG